MKTIIRRVFKFTVKGDGHGNPIGIVKYKRKNKPKKVFMGRDDVCVCAAETFLKVPDNMEVSVKEIDKLRYLVEVKPKETQ